MKNDNKMSRGKLDEGAIMQHELFMSYVRAGFTEPQALKLVSDFVTTTMMIEAEKNRNND